MNYKLIALDIDGTVLDKNKSISERTVNTIKKVIEAGVKVTFSTGRPIMGVRKLIRLFNIDVPVITYNGAAVVHPKTEEILFSRNLPSDDARKIWDMGLERDATMCIWSGNRLYGNKLDFRINEYKKLSGIEPKVVTDFEELVAQGIPKILWTDDKERSARWSEEFKAVHFTETTVCSSNAYFTELFNANVSKGAALSFVADYLGIPMSETMAFGDAMNDIPMIEAAGMGVAMGNAYDVVKEKADFVTLTNNEDGVAAALEKLIL